MKVGLLQLCYVKNVFTFVQKETHNYSIFCGLLFQRSVFFLFHNPWDEEKLRCLLMAIGNYSDDGRCENIKS